MNGTREKRYLIDSNIIIYHLDQDNIASNFLLQNFQDSAISMQAIENRKNKKIKLPDNIIVSTAQVYNLTLVTRNAKDFKALCVDILNPFDNNGAGKSSFKATQILSTEA